MMHGHEKSDLAIVAVKPANKAEQPAAERSAAKPTAAEPVEPRARTKGNADQQSTHWTQSQARVSQAPDCIRQAFAVTHPRWEPNAGKPHVRFYARGARQLASLPRPAIFAATVPRQQRRPAPMGPRLANFEPISESGRDGNEFAHDRCRGKLKHQLVLQSDAQRDEE